MSLKLMGKKCGMTQRFDKEGRVVACTLIYVSPNVVTQVKRKEKDGYNALQLGFQKVETKDPRTVEKRVSKPLRFHFQKGGVEPHRYLAETAVDDIEAYTVGQRLDLSLFEGVAFVDVMGTSKGKGFQGVMKRYGFSGGPASHGASKCHRSGGSTGMRSTPGRCLPGTKKPGRMGGDRVTVENLKVVHIDQEKNLLLVEGAVPGPVGAVVSFTPAKKKG